MEKRIIRLWSIFCLLLMIHSSSYAQKSIKQKPLVIEEQGSFAIGGTMIMTNHVYQTQDMFSQTIVSGGKGPEFAASTITILSKAQLVDTAKKYKEKSAWQSITGLSKSRTH